MKEDDKKLLEYDALVQLAKDLRRPVSTLLATADDPFRRIPSRIEQAKWFAKIWRRFDLHEGTHVRRVHYVLASQESPIQMWDSTDYQNTDECWGKLCNASRSARYLDLVPAEFFDDRRNPDPLEYDPTSAETGFISALHDKPGVTELPGMPPLPNLHLYAPVIGQEYHVEIWCEKTTMNDVLQPLAEQYRLVLITGMGDLSHTHCVKVVERAQKFGLPVRILYISDFDPSGNNMPVGVARKIEHRLYLKELFDLANLGIQLQPIALTEQQCKDYKLTRAPIKKSNKGKARFEERFGEGATELDALEALHPGELANIVEREIRRFLDPDLEQRVGDVANELEGDLREITNDVHKQHRTKIKSLQAQWRKIAQEHQRKLSAWRKRAKPVWQSISNSLNDRAPDYDAIDWPDPAPADEYENPLFDSTRDYVEQIGAYKEYQDKPTARRKRGSKNDD